MADTQNINAVTALQSIDANDSILVSDGNTSLAKINYNKLAKSIIEQYTGSTLVGSGQSIQSAFNALNSKITIGDYIPSSAGLDSYNIGLTINRTHYTESDTYPQDYSVVLTIKQEYNRASQIVFGYNGNIWHRPYDLGSWKNWTQV